MRIAIGGLCHETSTFTPVSSTWDRFFVREDAVVTTFRGTNTPIGGYIDGIESAKNEGLDFELVPLLFAEGHPAGPIAREVFDATLDELVQRLRDAGTVDGVLLYLHGSMVAGRDADQLDDAEGYILSAVREVVGSDVPV
ncbi:MAG: M81 family metallopeptidase, partial [Anaerolineae bacterium]|nr:M81 family metallopeptidase [Anaerolineae bacterium]